MARKAVIADGICINIIEIDESATEHGGHALVSADGAQIGYTYADGVFTAPAIPLESARSAKKGDIDAYRDSLLHGGYTHDFTGFAGVAEDGSPIADCGPQVLQTRGVDDKMNWDTLDGICSKMIVAGHGSLSTAIRTKDNVNVSVTFSQASGVMLEMALWGADVMRRSWVVKAILAQMSTVEQIAAMDIATEFANADP